MFTAAKRLTTVADLRRNGNPTTGWPREPPPPPRRETLLEKNGQLEQPQLYMGGGKEGLNDEREGDAQKREEIRGLEEASEENTGKNRPSSPALYYRPGNTPNGHRLTLK